jgi:predicted O-methyltransferase YrrM
LDTSIQELLRDLEKSGRENDARQEDRSKKMLNIAPETAHLVSLLIRSSQRKSLLEIGTSNGYSTIWLAWAASFSDGHVTSIDRDEAKHDLAVANLKKAGLRDRVDLQQGDATEVIAMLEGPFDFVLFDADRTSAPEQLENLLPKLLPGALVLADNALSHPDQIAAYLAAIEAAPELDHMIVPVGKGLSVAYKQR